MKIKISEAQLNRLPLLNESIADSPIIKIFYRAAGEAKERLNSLFLKTTSYSIDDIITGQANYDENSKIAESITDEIDAMGRRIEDQLQSVDDDSYDRLNYTEIENDIHTARFEVYYKADLIMDICSEFNSLHDFNERIHEYFKDTKPLDV